MIYKKKRSLIISSLVSDISILHIGVARKLKNYPNKTLISLENLYHPSDLKLVLVHSTFNPFKVSIFNTFFFFLMNEQNFIFKK